MIAALVAAPPHETTELVDRKALKRLGRYLIAEELARGGMAQLYLARKDGTSELCALKRLLIEFEADETARARFQREALVASHLSHPNIVRTFDAGFEGGTFCIASELIAGHTLKAVVERLRALGRSMPPEAAVAIALRVLDGLAYAHHLCGDDGVELEIVHRDLSPRNILIDFSGVVKIIDFGVARGKLDQFRTAPGVIVGSLEYMSPEQAAALPVDRRSDLYSIGVILYEMLTGNPLIPREGQLVDILNAVVRAVAPPICSVAPHLSPSFEPVLARALAKNVDQRFGTAGEMYTALAEAAAGLALADPPVLGRMLREIMPDEESKLLALIDRATRKLDHSQTERIAMPGARGKSDRHERTAVVDRPRGGRARQVIVRAVDEPPVVGTKLGAMVLDMPGESVPLSTTAFEAMRRKDKKRFYSLITLSAVAVILLGAVAISSLTRTQNATHLGIAAVPADEAREGAASPGVVSHARPGSVEQEPEPEVQEEQAPVPADVAGSVTTRVDPRPKRTTPPPSKVEEKRAAAAVEPPVEQELEAPKQEVKAPYPDLRRLLAQLRTASDRDTDTYYRLLGGIENAMSSLPAPAQKRIQSELNAAQLTYDVDAIARALEQLLKAQASSS